MATGKLTAGSIASLECPTEKSQAFLRDTVAQGLGVRATKSAKAFIFQSKLKDGSTIRMTIGDVRAWGIEDARKVARHLQTIVDAGDDPREIIRAKIEAKEARQQAIEAAKEYTLAKLFEAYCKHLETLGKANSARSARSLFKTHAPDSLKEQPAKDVSAENIADMLRAVTEKGKKRTAGALRSYLLAAYNIGLRARLDAALPIAFKEYGITANPVAMISAIAARAESRVLTNDELRTYLAAMDDRQSDKALLLALLAGGQRMEQILRVTVADWSPDTQTLRLFDSKGRRQTPRTHLLPLAPRAAAIVQELVTSAEKAKVKELFTIDPQTPGKRAKAICEAIDDETGKPRIEPAFNLRDIRRTVETRMAGLGISKDIRAQVLSHGLGGVQDKHYDMHSYETEKRNALTAWENWLTATEKNEKPAPNVVQIERKTAA